MLYITRHNMLKIGTRVSRKCEEHIPDNRKNQ